jgi:mannose-6-phosphate isomerase
MRWRSSYEEFWSLLSSGIAVTEFYPLAFEPLYQYRLWGGRKLGQWLKSPLPQEGPVGEAWLLSDREDQPSRVANGPLKGRTIAELLGSSRTAILGKLATRFERFPLLLKFLDVHEMLSVQVHPPDDRTDLIPKGNTGKTEAWVVLEAEPAGRIYAGLKPGTTAADLRALNKETVDRHLASFTPSAGQTVLIEAGTVHALGDGVLVFEIQENSDVTFRLYDWNHIDPKTRRPRPLQVEEALSCIDFSQGAIKPVATTAVTSRLTRREQLVDCDHFRLSRIGAEGPFTVGAQDLPTALVGLDGRGEIEHSGKRFGFAKGDVLLLPAVVGPCRLIPQPPITLLECEVPEANATWEGAPPNG